MDDDGGNEHGPRATRRALLRGAAAGIPAGGLALAGGCMYDTQLFLVGGTPRPRRSDDVLRYTMYAESYGREREAARLYASIATVPRAARPASDRAPSSSRSATSSCRPTDSSAGRDRALSGADRRYGALFNARTSVSVRALPSR